MIGHSPSDATAAGSVRAAAHARGNAGTWVLIASILGSSMVFIDGSAVNVILPVLQADLRAPIVELQWVVVGYTLFLSSLMLVGGSLGDHFGRRRVFVGGVVLFAAASMLCGLSPNAWLLIGARCLQGVGSAMMTPGSLALIGANFDEKSRGQAIGTWSSVTAVMAAVGPGLGGWLAQHASWRWIFFINVPIAITVVAVSLYGVPESHDREKTHHVDWLGALTCTAALGTFVYGLTFSLTPISLIGCVLLVTFVAVEARSPAPLVPLTLFASKTFSGVNGLTLLLYAALGGALFFLPFKMIQVDGYTPTAAGFGFLPFIACIFVLSPIAGRLVRTVGFRLLLVVGPLITGAGFVLLAFGDPSGNYLTAYLPGVLTLGLGMSMAVAPLTTVVMESVDADRMGAASGINNAISRVAGMLAIAALGALLANTFSARLEPALQRQRVPERIRAEVFADRGALAATSAAPGTDPKVRAAVQAAVIDSYLAAFQLTMLTSAVLAAAGALVSAFTIDGLPAKRDQVRSSS